MKPHMHPHPHPDGQHREHFLEFIRQVSPEADPTSVLLFGQVQRASSYLIQAVEKELDTAGLSWAKFRLLMNLGRAEKHGAAEGVQPSELSDMQGISRNTVSALIASLEEDGLISRELHGTDRRRFVIRLTPEGRKVLKSKLNGQFKFVTHCFAMFSATERQAFLDFLTRLNQGLSEKAK
ncbi:MAG: MarR family transcriptional regulator [Chloroflexi bacterium]|nr:MarR family transcriptional regulator [Chloroflexota bacterium]